MKISTYTILFLITAITIYLWFPEQQLPENASIDYILVKKSERKMEVYQDG